MYRILIAAAAAALLAPPAFAGFSETIDAHGVQSAAPGTFTAGSIEGVQTFNTLANSPAAGMLTPFMTDFGTGGVIDGAYSGIGGIQAANQYGGAGGTGNYIATRNTVGYKLLLTTDGVPGVNYFGLDVSALDMGNQIVFKENGVVVGSLNPDSVIAAIGAPPNGYYGNPNAAFSGENGTQPYVFINFFETGGVFNEIDFFENPLFGTFESDNQTVAFIPNLFIREPAAAAILGVGCLAAFAVVRRRRAV